MVKHLPTMRETRVQSLGWEDLLEKEMATHSSILAWEIPWMEDPGRLQSMGSQRVRHDWATSLHFIRSRPWYKGSPLERFCTPFLPRKESESVSHSVTSDSLQPGSSLQEVRQAPLSMEFSRQEYQSPEPVPFSREFSRLRDRTWVSCIAGDSLPSEPPGKDQRPGMQLNTLQSTGQLYTTTNNLAEMPRVLRLRRPTKRVHLPTSENLRLKTTGGLYKP